MTTLKISFLALIFVCLAPKLAFSHEGGSSEHQLEGKNPKLIGSLELRPSFESNSGNTFGENTIEVGYKFSDSFLLGYQQEIHHNISMKEENPEHEGLGLHLEEGFLNAHFHDIWESKDESSSLSLEPRLYLPISSEEREKGFLTSVSSYLSFRSKVGEVSSVSIMDAPVIFLYSKSGERVGEEFGANPLFQNRFRVAFNTAFFEQKLSIALPILFYLTRHSDYDPEAEHNNAWTTFVGVAPEINYALTSHLTAGFAVITPNLLNSQDTDHSVNHGRTNTVSQFILRAQL